MYPVSITSIAEGSPVTAPACFATAAFTTSATTLVAIDAVGLVSS